MKKRRKPSEGDILEIPLTKSFAYARVYRDGGYGVYRIRAKVRPKIQDILDSGIENVFTVCELASQRGLWPVIAQIPFQRKSEGWSPTAWLPGKYQVLERGKTRPGTDADKNLPTLVFLDENEFVSLLEGQSIEDIRGTVGVTKSQQAVLRDAMSVDRNNVAEQVRAEFEALTDEGCSPSRAIAGVITIFKDALDDPDFVNHFWLALADLAIKHHCITDSIRRKVVHIIESGVCFDVVETWSSDSKTERERARQFRLRAIQALRRRLDSE